MRKVCIAAVMILSLLFCSSCAEKEPEPLRICVDISCPGLITSSLGVTPVKEVVDDFLYRFEQAGGPTDIAVEIVPPEGAERETMLARLRVEIASGDGPDVFILACDAKSDTANPEEALFLMPEKAMELDYFLPLDEYIENNTQYTEWDKLNSVVLDAGRNEEGLQLVPLAYTFPVTVYRQSEATHIPDKTLTWEDMLTSEDAVLRAAAVWTDNKSSNYEGCPFMMTRDALPEYILGDIADFSAEELLFTEEELGTCMADIFELADQYQNGEFADAPLHYNEMAKQEFNIGSTMADIDGKTYDTHNNIPWDTPPTIVPLYSNDGGVTATITSFAAINRNTLRPDDAYAVLDFLLSKEVQCSGGIYSYLYMYGSSKGSVPMHNELMNGPENCLYEWIDRNRTDPDLRSADWSMKPAFFEAYAAARDQITRARFRSVLDIELDNLYWDYHKAIRYDTGETDEIVAKAYRTMQQMVRE